MKVVMDSDCLVKLTKAGLKEMTATAMQVHIPPTVKMETVDEAKPLGYQDAAIIENNINNGTLKVVRAGKTSTLLSLAKGEEDAVALYQAGGYDAIASDDRRFLNKLESANIPYLTPTACLIFLYKGGRIVKTKALDALESLKPFVSREEYSIARLYLKEGA